jgi:hypothetical protein
MAFHHGKDAAVLYNEFNLSGDVTQYNWSRDKQTVNVTTLGNDDMVYIAGIAGGKISVQGVWNSATDASDEEIVATDTAENVISASPQGFTAIGDRVHMVNGLLDDYQPRTAVNDAVRFSSGYEATAGAYGGVVLHHNNQESSTGNFASNDYGSGPTTNGGTAFLHVLEFNGTTATVTVEDSANDSTFGSLVAFTAATGLTSEKVTVAGDVERYVRVNLAGTFTTITFVVSFARHL